MHSIVIPDLGSFSGDCGLISLQECSSGVFRTGCDG
jgi:hypothetical protein